MNFIYRNPILVIVILILYAIPGCGGDYQEYAKHANEAQYAESPAEVAEPATGGVTQAGGADTPSAANMTANTATANRKIIYNSTIGLVVDDYRQFEQKLPALVTKHGGFVANSDTDRRYNDQQSGSWVIRIPVDSYSAFLSGVSSLGFAESRSENAQDVTEEYVDIEARIKNKRTLEGRIITMLEERVGKLADVLEIERELSRVREEIERMEGRLRFLKDRTTLATITIRCREQKEYQPAEAPTFTSRIDRSWTNSISSLRVTAENVVIVLIAMLPWIVVLGVPLIVIWKLLKRCWKTRRDVA